MTSPTSNAPGRIFISYRRDDTAYSAGWLFDRLASHFGKDQVFKDVDSIELGDDFAEVITAAVGSCDVLLALIGDRWLTITDEDGRRRVDNSDDFVRVEIEAALTRNVRVIPILVGAARMPRTGDLPASMAGLVRRQALELSPSRFDSDLRRLLTVLDRTITEMQPFPAATGQGRPAVTQLDADGQDRQETERAAAEHRQQVEQLQQQIREHGAARDWDAVLAVNDQLAALDPTAADPDGLASTAREQITRDREADPAKTGTQQSAGAQDRAGVLQEVPRTSSAARKRRRLIAAAIGGTVALAAVIIPVTLLGGGSSPGVRIVKYHAVRAGDCFQGYVFGSSSYPENFQVVPCSGKHEAEIILADDAWGSGAYPGDHALDSQSHNGCKIAFSSYAGVAYGSQSRLIYDFFNPNADTWKSGDRRLICVVHLESGLLNGSVRGTGQ
jgi:TIR domain/Septum formation